MEKQNLIIIMIDGGRYDWVRNSSIFTKLQLKSTYFTQAITYGPHTIAAMHAVFSGSYGNRNGTNSYWSTYKFKKEKFKTITEYFHEKGYFTYADVINELVVPKQGFDQYIIHNELEDDLTERHSDVLEKLKEKNIKGKKIFTYLHYSNIHTGIMQEVLKKYDNFSKEFFEQKKQNEERYDELFKNAENYLKKILDKIIELEFDKNSLILVMSDHGISIGEKFGERAYGAFCYDYTLRTFAYFMGEEMQNKIVENQVRTVDFMPTILDYFGIEIDEKYEKMDGESLIPLINGEKREEKIAFSETGNPLKSKEPPKEPNTKSVRTSNWKFIFNEHDGKKELYNLKEDPHENNNLIGKGLKIEMELLTKLKDIIRS